MSALKQVPPRSVSCYDIDSCELVHTFASASEAAKYFSGKTSNSGSISDVINGQARSAYGYLWKYDNQPDSVLDEIQKRYYDSKGYSTSNQPVINIETGEQFGSVNSAATRYGIDGRMISACCRGQRENAGGFHWRFEGMPQVEYIAKQHRGYKRVVCVETGIVYESTKEAALQSGIYINKLRDCLKGRTELAGG